MEDGSQSAQGLSGQIVQAMKLRIVILWVAASLCLAAALFVQRQLTLDCIREDLNTEARLEAQALARDLARTLLDARAETEGDFDEVLASPAVFELMENRDVEACAVYGTDRLLEAQMRESDGTIAPLDGLARPAQCEWTEKVVTDTGEELGKVWIALEPDPWQARMRKVEDKSLWHMVALTQAGTAAFFVMGLLVLVLGRRKQNARDEGAR